MKIKEASKLSGIDLIQEDNIIHRGANKGNMCKKQKGRKNGIKILQEWERKEQKVSEGSTILDWMQK